MLIFGVEYTKTVVFAWMFIEGLYLHNKLVVSVFTFEPNYILYYLIGWGELICHIVDLENPRAYCFFIQNVKSI